MRFLGAGLLVAALALPVAAQAPRFVKIDIQARPEALCESHKTAWGRDLPETVEIRMPLSLVKAALEGLDIDEGEGEIKINGKGKRGVKVAQLMDLLRDARAGDMLIEVKTSNGGLVKVTLE